MNGICGEVNARLTPNYEAEYLQHFIIIDIIMLGRIAMSAITGHGLMRLPITVSVCVM
jgi:hypothetical protein